MEGASCRPGPSPTARALRLEGLRVDDGTALGALLDRLPDPPWDVEISPDDELAGPLAAAGFEVYARTVVMARPLAGLSRAMGGLGVRVEPYRNEWAEDFAAFEKEAMSGLAAFEEMGQPTGYEQAEGFDCCLAARDEGDQIVGFAQAMVPEGWINWLGVTPAARRLGIGHRLIWEVGDAVKAGAGTHLAALVEEGTDGMPFLAKLGFTERGRRALMIHRGPKG